MDLVVDHLHQPTNWIRAITSSWAKSKDLLPNDSSRRITTQALVAKTSLPPLANSKANSSFQNSVDPRRLPLRSEVESQATLSGTGFRASANRWTTALELKISRLELTLPLLLRLRALEDLQQATKTYRRDWLIWRLSYKGLRDLRTRELMNVKCK